MKTSSKVIIAILAVLVIVGAVELSKGASDTYPSYLGRYMLFGGKYVELGTSAQITESGVFKIDTSTGKTWKYATGRVDGKPYEQWQPIGE